MKAIDSKGYRNWDRVAILKVDMYIWECTLSPYYKAWDNGWGGVDYLKFITEVRREFNSQTQRL